MIEADKPGGADSVSQLGLENDIIMENQINNFDVPEDELGAASVPFEVPILLRLVISAIGLSVVGFSVYYFSKYMSEPGLFASPSDLGLTTMLIFSFSVLFVTWVPWKRLGLRITRIGGIEFKEIVAEQASEHAEEISYLQDRIEALEAYVRRNDGIIGLTESFEEPALRRLLIDFLTTYKDWAFSPSRIRAWGAKQQGFADLSKYDYPFIRSTLQKLVSEGLLETRISKKGNTLYRIPLP